MLSAASVHILDALVLHRARYTSSPAPLPPLFVLLQGPQGSGKTHLTNGLTQSLSASPHNLRIASLSIDDLYLKHDELRDLARLNPDNKLWTGRGQPGTHDVRLGADVLRRLFSVNQSKGDAELELPVFDKSLFGGEGDRLPKGHERNPRVKTPPRLDVVLLEGWCAGFSTRQEDVLVKEFEEYIQSPVEDNDPFDRTVLRKEDVLAVNRVLAKYESMWKWFTCFVQIKPPHPYREIYKWRLEAEHNMKAENGGKGMSDEQVKRFIDRYVPGYLFFLSTIEHRNPDLPLSLWSQRGAPGSKWEHHRNGLRILVDEQRQVLDVEKF